MALAWSIICKLLIATPLTSRYIRRKSVARRPYKGGLFKFKGVYKKNKKQRNKIWLTIICGKYSTTEKVEIESRKSDVTIDLFRIYLSS